MSDKEKAAALPADDDLIEVVRTFCAIAARMRDLPDEKRAHYPAPTCEGSPLLAAARAACVARGYTEDGLAVEGVTYPAAAPAPESQPAWRGTFALDKGFTTLLDAKMQAECEARRRDGAEGTGRAALLADASLIAYLDAKFAALAAPVPAAQETVQPAAPILTITGRVCEVGAIEQEPGRGMSLAIDEEYIDLTGLTEEETRKLADHYNKRLTITVSPAMEAQRHE